MKMNLSDPDTHVIDKLCKSLVGSNIQLYFCITLNDDTSYNGEISNCNIVGDVMEDVIYPYIKSNLPTFEKGPKQTSPDFFNRSIWEWELKCFNSSPSFDIANFHSYIYQLQTNLIRKLFRTQYLVFRYKIIENSIIIVDYKRCNVWQMISYNGKHPISVQMKKGFWYNIRPCKFNDMNNISKTPKMFVKQICKAIELSPNDIKDKQKIITDIYDQFEYESVLEDITRLNIDSSTGGVAILPNRSA